MPTVVVGAGPAGLFTAIALARRGRRIVVVDRDPGPSPSGEWRRRGVMQFEHAHTFRGPAVEAMQDEMPDALDALRRAGARVVTAEDGTPVVLHSRRTLFERVLREIACREPTLTMRTGHADGVRCEAGRAVGVHVGGDVIPADVVVDASGRASRVMRDPTHHKPEGGPCGAAYVTRQYRLADAADPGPVNSPVGLSLSLGGYFAVAFLHDGGHFSVTITHDGTDPRMHALRHREVFEAAVRAVPMLDEWIDPRRAEPLTPVLPGGRLYNSYRGQLDDTGRPVLPGLIRIGDSVCTTTPLAGRGVSLAFRQAQALATLLARDSDTDAATVDFDAWCRTHIRPWFLDHVHCDGDRLRRWAGGGVDLDRPLPSDLVVAAAAADPGLRPLVAPYDRMAALPESLDAHQGRAKAVYATGWRPPVAPGPDREELAALCLQLSERLESAFARV